jgi:hypothetical protein
VKCLPDGTRVPVSCFCNSGRWCDAYRRAHRSCKKGSRDCFPGWWCHMKQNVWKGKCWVAATIYHGATAQSAVNFVKRMSTIWVCLWLWSLKLWRSHHLHTDIQWIFSSGTSPGDPKATSRASIALWASTSGSSCCCCPYESVQIHTLVRLARITILWSLRGRLPVNWLQLSLIFQCVVLTLIRVKQILTCKCRTKKYKKALYRSY